MNTRRVLDVLVEVLDMQTVVARPQQGSAGPYIALVVEGVETEAQLRHFHQYGELEIQDYYFSRPLPAPQLKEWLATAFTRARAAEPAR